MDGREDFRTRKVPGGYRIWQRIGSGWEPLSDIYPTRADARAAVQRWLA
jgi:hypothetical protein